MIIIKFRNDELLKAINTINKKISMSKLALSIISNVGGENNSKNNKKYITD